MSTRRRAIIGMAGATTFGQQKETMFADAEAYERFMGRWSRLVAPLLVKFAGIPRTGRFLDIGSGTGALSFAIAAQSESRVVGVDRSSQYVAYAASRNTFGDRVRFEEGDALQLRYADAVYDGVLSLLVFNFIPDPAKALGEAKRTTKSGGVIAAAVWDYGDRMRMLRVFWDAAAAVDRDAAKLDERLMPLCQSGQLSALWRAGGLGDVEEAPLEVMLEFKDFEDFWSPFLLGQGPAGAWLGKASDKTRTAVRNEVKRRLPVQAGDQPFALPARMWAVRGRR